MAVAIKEGMNEQGVREALSSRFQNVSASVGDSGKHGIYGNLLAQSAAAYQRKWKKDMPASSKAVLLQSLNKMTSIFQNRDHLSREMIASATSNIAKVDNPITLAYNLMSILIPNFAYTEVIGIQPIPTKESPIFYPRIVANENRNNVAKGTTLLGSTNWSASNNFTTNQVNTAMTISGTGVSLTAPEGNIIPGSVAIQLNIAGLGSYVIFEDGKGALVPVDGVTAPVAGTVNYATGAIALTLAAAAGAGSTATAKYRYEFSDTTKPAQAVLEWVTEKVRAEPYRIRTIYELDDFFQVKQVLQDYDIDSVLSSSVAGYINKEISGGVFDDLLLKTDADFAWDSVAPAGVAWLLHKYSLLQTFTRASNGIRQNIARADGNIVVCGNEWCNFLENLGDDHYKVEKYAETPIGPYVAGTLSGKYKILKNQDYPDNKAVMVYKRDDVDASIIGGVFIGLYATNPVSLDDLKVIQGMGTQFGWVKTFDNSIVSLTLQQ